MSVHVDLTWETGEPERIRALLAAAGLQPGPGEVLAAAGLSLHVTRGRGHDRLVFAAAGRARPAPERAPVEPRLLAVGLATIDLERASAGRGARARELGPDTLLGARAAEDPTSGAVLLEPSGEGRLAATLARNGEGPAAVYLGVAAVELGKVLGALRRLGEHPRHGEGPYGPQVLAWTRPPWGPHVLLVAGQVEDPAPGGPLSEHVRPVVSRP